MNIKKKAVKGVSWTTFSSITGSTVQLIQLIILARLLSPNHFGLLAILTVVIGFSQIFIDMGISNAIIHRQTITNKELSSLYWVNVGMGLIFFTALFLLSPVLSDFYETPELNYFVKLVAINFLIKPFGQQFMILLQKELNFKNIAQVEVIGRIISFAVVIILAYNDYGVLSVVYGTILFSLLSTIGFFKFGLKIYKPELHFASSDITKYLNFGFYQMGEKTINYLTSQFDTILIGKILGVEALGIYNVAKNLVIKPTTIINPIVTKVTFPLMSKISDDLKLLKTIFLKTLTYLSFINFPVFLLLALNSEAIILLMFGEKWLDAAPVLQILSFAYILRSIGNPAGSLLLSLGKADTAFYWNLIIFVFYPTSVFIGSFWGLQGIAIAAVLLQVILFLPNWKFIVYKSCEATAKEYHHSLLYPFIFSIISIGLASIFYYYVEEPISKVLWSTIVFVLIYLMLLNYKHPNIKAELRSIILNPQKIKNS